MNGRTNVVNNNSDSLGGIIPLEAPNNFVVVADNAKCLLTWTDPKDKYADELGEITDEGDQLVSQFAYTRIVRKTTGYPSGPNDGDIVTESSTRNQYQSTAYSDEGLVNNTLYYYAAFTCNTDGVWSGSVTGSATPKAYDPILANNTWEQINEVANEGIAASVWSIGDEIDIIIEDNTYTTVIIAFDHMDKSDGTGKAPITMALKHLLNQRLPHGSGYTVYSGSEAGIYVIKSIPTLLNSQLLAIIPSVVAWQSYLISSSSNNSSYNALTFGFTPSEIDSQSSPRLGYDQFPYFSTIENRIKKLDNGNGSAQNWGLTVHKYYPTTQYQYGMCVTTSGSVNTGDFRNSYYYICFGFCIGKTPS